MIDFKYGKSPDGRVDADHNPQMMLYALGAYEAYRILYEIHTVRMSIVQPRLPDGISEWECSLEDLLKFGEVVKDRAALAIQGVGDFVPGPKTCRYCRARGRCRARAEKNVELAFKVKDDPALLTFEEMGKYLKDGQDVAKWLKDIEASALEACLSEKRSLDGKRWPDELPETGRIWMPHLPAWKKPGSGQRYCGKENRLPSHRWKKSSAKRNSLQRRLNLLPEKRKAGTWWKIPTRAPAITNKISAAEAFKEETDHE